MLDNDPKTIIADTLPVDTGHVVPRMSHDGVHCHLVARLAADGLERMAKRVKFVAPARQPQLVQQLPHRNRYLIKKIKCKDCAAVSTDQDAIQQVV
jgi:hypothetical protein